MIDTNKAHNLLCFVLRWDLQQHINEMFQQEGENDSQEQGVKFAEVITLSMSERVGN